jgi:hypothetical protein
MKTALTYTAIALVSLLLATELVTTLRPAIDAPLATVSQLLNGAK